MSPLVDNAWNQFTTKTTGLLAHLVLSRTVCCVHCKHQKKLETAAKHCKWSTWRQTRRGSEDPEKQRLQELDFLFQAPEGFHQGHPHSFSHIHKETTDALVNETKWIFQQSNKSKSRVRKQKSLVLSCIIHPKGVWGSSFVFSCLFFLSFYIRAKFVPSKNSYYEISRVCCQNAEAKSGCNWRDWCCCLQRTTMIWQAHFILIKALDIDSSMNLKLLVNVAFLQLSKSKSHLFNLPFMRSAGLWIILWPQQSCEAILLVLQTSWGFSSWCVPWMCIALWLIFANSTVSLKTLFTQCQGFKISW